MSLVATSESEFERNGTPVSYTHLHIFLGHVAALVDLDVFHLGLDLANDRQARLILRLHSGDHFFLQLFVGHRKPLSDKRTRRLGGLAGKRTVVARNYSLEVEEEPVLGVTPLRLTLYGTSLGMSLTWMSAFLI